MTKSLHIMKFFDYIRKMSYPRLANGFVCNSTNLVIQVGGRPVVFKLHLIEAMKTVYNFFYGRLF